MNIYNMHLYVQFVKKKKKMPEDRIGRWLDECKILMMHTYAKTGKHSHRSRSRNHKQNAFYEYAWIWWEKERNRYIGFLMKDLCHAYSVLDLIGDYYLHLVLFKCMHSLAYTLWFTVCLNQINSTTNCSNYNVAL